MDPQLARAGLEDEPTLLGLRVLDAWPFENVAQERAGGPRVVGVDERVQGGDQ
jgi:hypothetical protein